MAFVLDTFARAVSPESLQSFDIAAADGEIPTFLCVRAPRAVLFFFFLLCFFSLDKVVKILPLSRREWPGPLLKIPLSHLTFMRAPVTVNGEWREIRGRPRHRFDICRADDSHQARVSARRSFKSNAKWGPVGESKRNDFFFSPPTNLHVFFLFFFCVAICS